MNDFYQEKAARAWTISDVNVLAPVRGWCRLVAVWLWMIGCYAAVRTASILLWFHRPLRRRACRKIARTWLMGMPPLLGLRIHIHGRRPEAPYFLVVNHISWVDFIVMNLLCDCRCVAMAEMQDMPILGAMVKALEAIFVYRVREDVPRVKNVILDSIRDRRNVLLAPEGTISPGRSVLQFHASFLQPAVDSRKPVHYASITFKTPDGCPPPSEMVLYGPDPHFPDVVSNPELWGPKRTFLDHFLRLVSLPYHEAHVRFGEDPMLHEDHRALANGLHAAVKKIFSPLD